MELSHNTLTANVCKCNLILKKRQDKIISAFYFTKELRNDRDTVSADTAFIEGGTTQDERPLRVDRTISRRVSQFSIESKSMNYFSMI